MLRYNFLGMVRMARLCRPDPAKSELDHQLRRVIQQTAVRRVDLRDLRARIINRKQ